MIAYQPLSPAQRFRVHRRCLRYSISDWRACFRNITSSDYRTIDSYDAIFARITARVAAGSIDRLTSLRKAAL